jgi:hypothetical protein
MLLAPVAMIARRQRQSASSASELARLPTADIDCIFAAATPIAAETRLRRFQLSFSASSATPEILRLLRISPE